MIPSPGGTTDDSLVRKLFSVVPAGLLAVRNHPGVLTPGYFRLFLRDVHLPASASRLSFMLRTPARRVRMARRRASSSPNLRMENCFFRTTPSSGLHAACQYFRHGLTFRSITRCTP